MTRRSRRTVNLEKSENGDERARLREHLQFLTGRRVAALMSAEIGGGNGLLPITWAARIGLPVVDADGMGRAFPEVPQVAMHLAGIPVSPAVMTDERGNLVVFRTISGHWMERLERAAAVEFGGAAASTEFSLTAAQARGATVRNSVSLAIRIGEAIAGAGGEPPDATSPPPGCVFHPRCPLAVDRCATEAPKLRTVRPARLVACHRAEEVLAGAMTGAGQSLGRSRPDGAGGLAAKGAPAAWPAPADSGDGPRAS